MSQSESEFFRVRLEKVKKLRDMGIDPYPARFHRTHTSAEAISEFENSAEAPEEIKVSLAGRVIARRGMGKATFLDISDGDGTIQILLRQNQMGEEYEILEQLDIGDWIGVNGTMFRTRTDQISAQASKLHIICKALRPLPEKWHGLTDTETRYRQRYLDLIASETAMKSAKSRSKLVSSIRRFMDDMGFIEVETPMLVPIAAGGMATPFSTHHNSLNRNLYLRIATELHLKRLIVGGFEKVYEIGRVFRNEGIDQQHNPEFTTMESYEAFADYNDVMAMVENMVSHCAKAVSYTHLTLPTKA